MHWATDHSNPSESTANKDAPFESTAKSSIFTWFVHMFQPKGIIVTDPDITKDKIIYMESEWER